MITIHKELVPIDDAWHEIPGGRVVHVDYQPLLVDVNAAVSVWFEHDADAEPTTRQVRLFGTGQPILEESTRHLGSVLLSDGQLVVHLRELVTEPGPSSSPRIVVTFTDVTDPVAVGRDVAEALRRYEQAGGRL